MRGFRRFGCRVAVVGQAALALEAPAPVMTRSPASIGAADLHGNYCRATQPGVVNAVICILLCNARKEKELPAAARGGTWKHYHPSSPGPAGAHE